VDMTAYADNVVEVDSELQECINQRVQDLRNANVLDCNRRWMKVNYHR
jgi:hypothetical protein